MRCRPVRLQPIREKEMGIRSQQNEGEESTAAYEKNRQTPESRRAEDHKYPDSLVGHISKSGGNHRIGGLQVRSQKGRRETSAWEKNVNQRKVTQHNEIQALLRSSPGRSPCASHQGTVQECQGTELFLGQQVVTPAFVEHPILQREFSPKSRQGPVTSLESNQSWRSKKTITLIPKAGLALSVILIVSSEKYRV